MIITIQPGERVKVPAATSYVLAFASSFTLLELNDPATTFRLIYTGPSGEGGVLSGAHNGTDVEFIVPGGTFTPGEWAINPAVTIGGIPRGFVEPCVLIVIGQTESHPENC